MSEYEVNLMFDALDLCTSEFDCLAEFFQDQLNGWGLADQTEIVKDHPHYQTAFLYALDRFQLQDNLDADQLRALQRLRERFAEGNANN